MELDVPTREAFMAMRYKCADMTNVQPQLCRPGDFAERRKRFLDTRGEGVFHLGFSVERCDDGVILEFRSSPPAR